MSSRKKVEVDEAVVQRMMAREETYLSGKNAEPVEKPDDSEIEQELPPKQYEQQTQEENLLSENDSTKTPKKRKVPKSDFSELFLKERTVKNRKQIYISVETYDMIRSYLKYIGDVSFIAYIDNILLQHIEEHKDTITELFNKKVSQPFQ